MRFPFKFKVFFQPFDFGEELKVAMASAEDERLTVEEDLGLGPIISASGKRDPSSRPDQQSDQTRTHHTQSKANSKRAKNRATKAHPARRQASDRTREEHVQLAEPQPVGSGFSTTNLRATRGAYSAWREDRNPSARKAYSSPAEVMSENPGFTLVRWDGWYGAIPSGPSLLTVCCSEARPFIDEAGRIFAIAAGKPCDKSYDQAANNAFQAIQDTGTGVKFNAKSTTHRRGGFPALNVGVSYGKGQKQPESLKTDPYSDILLGLLENPAISRLASFASGTSQSPSQPSRMLISVQLRFSSGSPRYMHITPNASRSSTNACHGYAAYFPAQSTHLPLSTLAKTSGAISTET